jgi:hypothetical protein
LEQIGVPVCIYLLGIADNSPKRQSLEAVGATIFPTLAAALECVPEF